MTQKFAICAPSHNFHFKQATKDQTVTGMLLNIHTIQYQ